MSFYNNWFKSSRAIALAFVFLFSSCANSIANAPLFNALAQRQAQPAAPQALPIQWPRSHDYDVQHYKNVISFDLPGRSVSGETTITLRPFKNEFKEIELDAGDMTIRSVSLAGGAPLKFHYEEKEKLFVEMDRAYPAGRDLSITVAFSAKPKKGLTFISPTASDPTRPYQIWSSGEAESNHYWFPCYDYPNDKATAEMIATADEKYTVISNGELVSTKPDPANKTRTWRWRLDKPFSSYLISVVIGEYAEIKGSYKKIPVSSYVYPGDVENGKISLSKLSGMVGFFSERIGYDYPYSKYAQIAVRDFPGALENITATTMTDTLVHDKRAHLDLSSDEVTSHELAHQWFGDLLTCRDWGEIWLNESFATFMANVWSEHDKGPDDYLYEMLANQREYFQSWFEGNRHPVSYKRYDDPDSVFDSYAYPRGGATLNMLRFVLGDELFWKAITHYVKKHEYQAVETAQFVVAIEEATGQNLQWFFDEWIYKMGHPEFEISSSYDEASKNLKLTVKQTQKADDKRPWYASPEFFTTPVDIAITTASREKINRVMLDKREAEFTFQLDSKPLIVNFDRGNYIIKQVKFNRGDDEVGYQLLNDADVTGRLRAASDLKSSRSETAAKALAQAAVKDKFWGVRLEAVKSLAQFKTDASRAALLEAVKDPDAHIRREAIKGLGLFKDAKLADLFVKIIKTDQSYYAVADAAKALGQTGAPSSYDVIAALLNQDSYQDIVRGGALSGLAALKDSRALEIGLKYGAPGNSAAVREAAFHMIAEVGKGDDRVLNLLTKSMKEESVQLLGGAIQAMEVLGDPRAIPALEEFLKGPLPNGLPESFVRSFVTRIINQLKSVKK